MIITLDVWRVSPTGVPRALWSMAVDRRRLRRGPGVHFAKLLGTGRGRDFRVGAADLTRWATLTVAEGEVPVPGFAKGAVAHCRIALAPIATRGTWSGQEPFGRPGAPGTVPPKPDTPGCTPPKPDTPGCTPPKPGSPGCTPPKPDWPSGTPPKPDWPSDTPPKLGATKGGTQILVLTRARLRLTRAAAFWRAIEPVSTGLRDQEGVLAAFGIGEAPVGYQGTVSIWRDPADIVRFAYRQPEHAAVVASSPHQRWYAEELFARFRVLDVTGDREVIGWKDSG